MEFKFNVNDILPENISLVDDKMLPFARVHRYDRMALASKQADLRKVIDCMGEASTKAQNLRSTITSAMKLSHSEHRLYISKDPNANCGLGAVVGIIKMGHKKLFVQDYQSVQYEVNPLCVLDFYVHESRQRTGCGKVLFDHMLKMEGLRAEQLAIDKPSHKFLSFLKKHFLLDKPIPQVNNFVIFPGFFHDLQAVGLVTKRGQRFIKSNSNQTPIHPYKRQSNENTSQSLNKRQAMTCQSPIVSQSNQTTTEQQPMETNTPYKDISLPPIVTRPPERHSASRAQGGPTGARWVLDNSLSSGGTSSHLNADRGLVARATSYSRYNSSRENSAPVIRTTKETQRVNSFDRVSSGGRKRNLHLTSTGNPFHLDAISPQQKPLIKSQVEPTLDSNANESNPNTGNPSYLTPAGNYSISQVYNTLYAQQRSLGTGWNVFGVPTGSNAYQARKNLPRTFPY